MVLRRWILDVAIFVSGTSLGAKKDNQRVREKQRRWPWIRKQRNTGFGRQGEKLRRPDTELFGPARSAVLMSSKSSSELLGLLHSCGTKRHRSDLAVADCKEVG
jgi:hypothetical protein